MATGTDTPAYLDSFHPLVQTESMKSSAIAAMFLVLFPIWAQGSDQTHPYQTTEAILNALQNRQPDFFLVDVRVPDEFRQKRIPGSINIPVEIIVQRLPTRNFNAVIVLVDRFGNRATRAKYALETLGYRRVYIFGKIRNWTGPLLP